MIETYWPMVLRIAGTMARRMRGYWTTEELASFGYDGLCKAIRGHDPAKGPWVAYAALRVRGAILDGVSMRQWHFLPRGRRPKQVCRQPEPWLDSLDQVRAMLWPLRPRTQAILRLIYENGLTSREVASKLGVTESLISKIHKSALRQIRTGSFLANGS